MPFMNISSAARIWHFASNFFLPTSKRLCLCSTQFQCICMLFIYFCWPVNICLYWIKFMYGWNDNLKANDEWRKSIYMHVVFYLAMFPAISLLDFLWIFFLVKIWVILYYVNLGGMRECTFLVFFCCTGIVCVCQRIRQAINDNKQKGISFRV